MRRPLIALTAVAASGTLVLSACAGGSSDVVAQPGSTAAGAAATSTLNLYAYAVPKVAFDVLIPAFQQTEAGKGVQFQQSYGASGDQSRKVAAGAEADFVNFSVEPDVTRLVDAGLVDANWNANADKGIPFGSVVTIVVRKGNPKGIKDWDDLLQPGVEVVTPNPFSSGSAKWNLLAPYAAKSEGGTDKAAGLAYVTSLVKDHVKVQPKSGREATETFLQGSGDVLLSYENEALFIEKQRRPGRARDTAPDLQDREPGSRAQGQQEPRRRHGLQHLPLHAGGPEAHRRGRLPAGRRGRRGGVRLDVPGAGQAVDHRRPRRLEERRRQPLQEGRR